MLWVIFEKKIKIKIMAASSQPSFFPETLKLNPKG